MDGFRWYPVLCSDGTGHLPSQELIAAARDRYGNQEGVVVVCSTVAQVIEDRHQSPRRYAEQDVMTQAEAVLATKRFRLSIDELKDNGFTVTKPEDGGATSLEDWLRSTIGARRGQWTDSGGSA